jgi:hypothetical protein
MTMACTKVLLVLILAPPCFVIIGVLVASAAFVSLLPVAIFLSVAAALGLGIGVCCTIATVLTPLGDVINELTQSEKPEAEVGATAGKSEATADATS